jgi:hypothetical protein
MRTEMTCSTRIKRCVFGLACLTIAPLLAQTAQATELVARHTSADSSELAAGPRARDPAASRDAEAGLARRKDGRLISTQPSRRARASSKYGDHAQARNGVATASRFYSGRWGTILVLGVGF